MELSPALTAAGFHVEKVALRYVKGWPERAPKPYRLFRDNKYVAAFPTFVAALRYANSKAAARSCDCGKPAADGFRDCVDCAVETVEAIDAGAY